MNFRLAAIMIAVAAAATVVEARPMAASIGVRRHLAQADVATTTFSVEWDLAFVPYPRVEARCGDLVTFRWEGPVEQTVAAIVDESSAAVLADCTQAKGLTEAATSGEYTEELLTPGTIYFVEPTNCGRGQVLVVNVACDEAAAMSIGSVSPDAQAAVDAAAPAPSA